MTDTSNNDSFNLPISDNPALCSALFDIAEALIKFARLWWIFWEQEERAYAQIYGEALWHIAKTGTYMDLEKLYTDLHSNVHPFTVRLLTRLRDLRSDEDEE
jgi:hypothetical protein